MSSIKIELRKEDVDIIKEICASFNNDPQELINVLHSCQEHFGYLPAEIQEVISECNSGPCCQDLWSCDILLIFHHDSERETSDKHMYGNCMLCKRCVKRCLMNSRRSLDYRLVKPVRMASFHFRALGVLVHADLHLLFW